MFALGINYLNGWAMAAADGARKEQAEWPPHPDRVFMALAAAWFEAGEDPDEGKALRWLETLPPPSIAASNHSVRSAVVSYVPVNDSSVSRRAQSSRELGKLRSSGLSVLPEHRSRQPRGFPVAVPHDPNVYLIWSNAELGAHRSGLESLTAKVTHVGHSASLVQAWVTEAESEIAPIDWEPTKGIAEKRLRVVPIGRLDTLIQAYNQTNVMEYSCLKAQSEALRGTFRGKGATARRNEKKRLDNLITEKFGKYPPVSLRPTPVRWQGYGRLREPNLPNFPCPIFDSNLVVLALSGKRVPATTTLRLTQSLRGALMDSCPEQPPPEWFSGHKPDGSPTTDPHMAMLPLPFVGSQYSDGRVMGLALALPRALNPQDASRCLSEFLYQSDTGLPREHNLFDGRWFECRIGLETRERPPVNLVSDTWTRRSRVWASVTPVALNRHFKGKDKWARAAESVKDACEHIGLTRPREALLHPVSLVEGAPHAREFPYLRRKSDGGRRSHVHVVLIFNEPVHGPIAVGAGRFRGYGLCRPMDTGASGTVG